MLKLAKVVQMRPDDHSADIVFLDNGARAAGVPIMAGVGASSRTGTVDQPAPTVGADKWVPQDSNETDITAVVGWFGKQPIIMGFLYPQVSQMLFTDANRRISRHTSDVYSTIDGQGNSEFFHPSGAYIRFGASGAHEDLTGKDLDGKWQLKAGAPVHIHIEQAGGAASIDLAPGGAIVVNTTATVEVTAAGAVSVTAGGPATVTAPSAKIDAATTHCTGALNVDGKITGAGGLAISGGSGATVAGSMAITGGEVTADGIALKGHHHSDPQGGSTGDAV